MKIMQIGNGGAFDFDKTNSSFLIKTPANNYLLFDCGRNVIDELIRLHKDSIDGFNIAQLKYVYISHMDDDHIGSLKSLIYYMYFVHKKKLHILINEVIYDDLNRYLKDMDSFRENYESIGDKLFIQCRIYFNKINIDGGLTLKTFSVKHSIPCMGLKISYTKDDLFGIIISGDTYEVIEIDEENKRYLIFQDYSLWDNPGSQVHCCKSLYLDSKIGRKNLTKYGHLKNIKFYHTGLPLISQKFLTIKEAKDQISNELFEELI